MTEKWFKVSTAALATNINVANVRGWMGKGWIFEEETKLAHKAGGTRYINLDGVRRLAVMGRLQTLGVPPERAFNASLAIEMGSMSVSWSGQPADTLDGQPAREAGELFPDGETFLICPAGDELPYVVNVKPGGDLGNEIINRSNRAQIDTVAIVHLNAVIREIDHRLQGEEGPDDADE